MNEAIGYCQADTYSQIHEKFVEIASPMLQEIGSFNFEKCAENPELIMEFAKRCQRPLHIIAYVAATMAETGKPVDRQLVTRLFNLSKTIDKYIIDNPVFEKIPNNQKNAILRTVKHWQKRFTRLISRTVK